MIFVKPGIRNLDNVENTLDEKLGVQVVIGMELVFT